MYKQGMRMYFDLIFFTTFTIETKNQECNNASQINLPFKNNKNMGEKKY